MNTETALWLEIKYGLCAAGKALENVLSPDMVHVDVRPSVDPQNASNYPFCVIYIPTESENPHVERKRDRAAIEIAGLITDPGSNTDVLDEIKTAIVEHFKGAFRVIGKYDDDGTPNPNKGLAVHCHYLSTTSDINARMNEKYRIIQFAIASTRA